jgi:hypothetical protein
MLVIWNACYLECLLFGMLVIWNACYLECLLFGILLYSTSFTKFYYGFTKIAGSVITYILQISLVYLEQSITSHST